MLYSPTHSGPSPFTPFWCKTLYVLSDYLNYSWGGGGVSVSPAHLCSGSWGSHKALLDGDWCVAGGGTKLLPK